MTQIRHKDQSRSRKGASGRTAGHRPGINRDLCTACRDRKLETRDDGDIVRDEGASRQRLPSSRGDLRRPG